MAVVGHRNNVMVMISLFLHRDYLVKLFWRKGPTNESVMELNMTTLEDFERYF